MSFGARRRARQTRDHGRLHRRSSVGVESLEPRLLLSVTQLTTGAIDHRWPAINDSGSYVYCEKVAGSWQVFLGGQQITPADGYNHMFPDIDNAGDIVYFQDGGSGGIGYQVVFRSAGGTTSAIQFSSRNNFSGAHRDAGRHAGIASDGTTISYYDFYDGFGDVTRTFSVAGPGIDFSGSDYPDINANHQFLFSDGRTVFKGNAAVNPGSGTAITGGAMGRINDAGDIVAVTGNLDGQGDVNLIPHADPSKVRFVAKASWADINDAGSIVVESPDSMGTRQLYVYSPSPDLTGVFVASPSTTTPGATISPSLSISNNSTATATGTELTKYYLSTTQSIDSTSILLGQSSEPINLTQGQSAAETPSLTIPSTAPSGSYYIIAQLNADGGISESDRTNDQVVSAPLRLTLPDLIGAWDPVTLPASGDLIAGQHLNATLRLANIGDSDATGSISVDIYLSPSPVIAADAQPFFSSTLQNISISPNDTSPFTVGFAVPTGLGFGGRYYINVRLNSDHGIPESDYGNNDFSSSTLKLIPRVVNVVTHGYGDTQSGFYDKWNALVAKLNTLPTGSLLGGSVYTEFIPWQSTTGFREAAIAVFLAREYPSTTAIDQRIIAYESQRSRALANAEAQAIITDLTRPDGVLGDPAATAAGVTDRQIIHLIGHSRGAAVNAQVAKLLNDKGYIIDQFTSLDGFSTDWPSVGPVLGDFPTFPIASVATLPHVLRKVNLQAQVPLPLSMCFDFSPGTADKYNADFPNLFAPTRSGFENSVFAGPSTFVPADHCNIVDEYLDSAGPSFIPHYLLENYEGMHLASPASTPPTPGRDRGSFATASPPLSASTDGGSDDFVDGTFEQLGSLLADLQSATLPNDPDPELQAFLAILANPTALLGTVWDISGSVRPVVTSTGTAVELAAGGSIGQQVAVPAQAEVVEFDAAVGFASPGDVLQVERDGNVIGSIPLQGIAGTGHFSAPFLASGAPAEITFHVSAAAGSAVRVQLDNLRVTTPPAVVSAAFDYARSPQSVSFSFDRAVSGAVQFQNITTGLPVDVPSGSFDPTTNTAIFSFTRPLPDGQYVATVPAKMLTDNYGAHPVADFVFRFFSLAGDANHDGTVNFSDLLTLAQNYGKSSVTFADGDFDGNGAVGFSDLLILAQNYGKTIATPTLANSILSAATAAKPRTRR